MPAALDLPGHDDVRSMQNDLSFLSEHVRALVSRTSDRQDRLRRVEADPLFQRALANLRERLARHHRTPTPQGR